jgi:MSHA pilin protein MshA
MVNKYPSAANIAALAGVTGTGYAATVAGTTATVQVSGAATPASCQVTYLEAAAGAAPTITATNTGC